MQHVCMSLSLQYVVLGFPTRARAEMKVSLLSRSRFMNTLTPSSSLCAFDWGQNPAPAYESDADCDAFEEWADEKMNKRPTKVRPCVLKCLGIYGFTGGSKTHTHTYTRVGYLHLRCFFGNGRQNPDTIRENVNELHRPCISHPARQNTRLKKP